MTTDNEKYVKRGQSLIIRDDPQRHGEVEAANRNKVGAPFPDAESLFAALVVKSMTGCRTGICSSWKLQTSIRTRSPVTQQLG